MVITHQNKKFHFAVKRFEKMAGCFFSTLSSQHFQLNGTSMEYHVPKYGHSFEEATIAEHVGTPGLGFFRFFTA